MNSPPRVVFNTVSVSSGAFVHEMNILQHLPAFSEGIEYHVLCSSTNNHESNNLGENLYLHNVRVIENSLEQPAETVSRLLWDNIALPAWVYRLQGDLLYFPLQITNLVDVAPKVIAVHNAAPFHLEAQQGRSRYESIRLKLLFLATHRSIQQAQRVIFFAEATRERVAQDIPAARDKGVVVPRGIPDGFEPKTPDPEIVDKYSLPEDFLLSVSNIARYKNQLELVTGYAKAMEKTEMPSLYLAGKTVDEDYARELDQHIQSMGVSESIQRMGFIDRDELPDLHAASTGFVFSSACETAPITVIEALACGSPIACSNTTSIPEICGDAALYFDPYDSSDIAETLVQFVNQEETREALSDAALKRVGRFSWERAAQKTYDIFEEVFQKK